MTSSSFSESKNRRLVVFAGPHKSASSSVQELFMKTAASNSNQQHHQQHHPSLINWTWPYNPRRRSYLPRKGFAPLVTEGEGFIQLIHETILQVWNSSNTNTNTSTNTSTNIILGTEELDRFGTTPWSHRDGIKAIRRVYELLQPELVINKMEIVVNYRRPRRDQWISIWKQLTRSNPRPYSKFICDPQEESRIWEYLDCVANPLGLAKALLEQGWNVRLMDMEGITSKGWDVGHVLACDVLQVPCGSNSDSDNNSDNNGDNKNNGGGDESNTHWLPGIDRPILQNQKSGNPELDESQLDDMEWALRRRDCGYRRQLEAFISNNNNNNNDTNKNNLIVYQGDTLWDGCPSLFSATKNDNDNDGNTLLFTNTTFLLNLLQNQMGCETFSSSNNSDNKKNAIQQWRHGNLDNNKHDSVVDVAVDKNTMMIPPQRPPPPKMQREQPGKNMMSQQQRRGAPRITPGVVQKRSETRNKIDPMIQTQLYILYMFLILTLAFMFRRLKCKSKGQHHLTRRLAGRHLMATRS